MEEIPVELVEYITFGENPLCKKDFHFVLKVRKGVMMTLPCYTCDADDLCGKDADLEQIGLGKQTNQ